MSTETDGLPVLRPALGSDVTPPAESHAPKQSVHQVLLAAVDASFAEDVAEGAPPPTEADVAARYEEVFRRYFPEFVDSTVAAIVEHAPGDLARARERRAAFQASLRAGWGEALDAFEVLTETFAHFGREVVGEAGRAGRLASDAQLSALARLHARASRTAHEVRALLEEGLADRALARCRTLHEVGVVATVLSRHDQAVAERYLLHATVRDLKATRDRRTHAAALGWVPPEDADVAALQAEVDTLKQRFGTTFAEEHGWAEGAVPRTEPKRAVTMADLERSVGLERFRLFYGWSSGSVHAGPQGLRSLGVPLAAEREVLVEAGSTSGLADPGQYAAIALAHVTGAFIPHLATPEQEVLVGAITQLVERCKAAFIQTMYDVEERTRQNIAAEAREGRGLADPGAQPTHAPT